MQNTVHLRGGFLPLVLVMTVVVPALSGCAGTVKNMEVVTPEAVVDTPAPGKAMVIFMRPSSLAFAVQSSVFEVVDEQPELVGIVAAKKKMTYQLDPGSHLFMVVSESADFMSAQLEADKTYYALVTPRPGAWKARFSLRPVSEEEFESGKFRAWLDEGEWVAKSPQSETWARFNLPDIKEKFVKYHAKWMEKAAEDRPRLGPKSGLP